MTADLLSIAAKRVFYLGQSQDILARNIANIDTPGYTPQQAAPFARTLDRASAALATTHYDDIASTGSGGGAAEAESVAERAPDGNAVSLNQQLAAVAHTQINQQYAVNVFKSYLGMFTTALGPNI